MDIGVFYLARILDGIFNTMFLATGRSFMITRTFEERGALWRAYLLLYEPYRSVMQTYLLNPFPTMAVTWAKIERWICPIN